MNKIVSLFLLIVLFIGGSYSKDNSLNLKNNVALLPDISVLGNILGKVSSNENDIDKDKILLQEIEFAYQGYLYPDIRSDIFFALHKHENDFEAEICEGYITFLKLWNNFSLKLGKQHLDFGKINKIHQHERQYVDQPLVITNFFGEHGLIGEGVNLSYLFPIPFFLQLDFGYWWNGVHSHSYKEKELLTPLVDIDGNDIKEILVQEENLEFSFANKIYSNRLWSSFNITKNSELEIGLSFVRGNGSHYLHHQDEAQVLGTDLTYKLFPSSFKKIIFQTEFLKAKREVPVGILERYGFYNYLGYQFSKYWILGVRYDLSENIFPNKVTTSEISGILTKNLTETTKLRLQYKRLIEHEVSEGYLQVVFGLGPHLHPLQ